MQEKVENLKHKNASLVLQIQFYIAEAARATAQKEACLHVAKEQASAETLREINNFVQGK